MPIDPSIPLSVNTNAPNQLRQWEPYDQQKGMAQALSLKAMVDENKQREQALQERQQLKEAYKNSDLSTPEGQEKSLKEISGISPEAGASLRKNLTEQQMHQSTIEKNKSEIVKQKIDRALKMADIMGRVGKDSLDAYQEAKSGINGRPASDPIAMARAQTIKTQGVVEAFDAGLISEEQFMKAMKEPFDPRRAQSSMMMSESVKQQIKDRQEQMRLQIQDRNAASNERRASAAERRASAYESRVSNADGTNKAPSGYRWSETKPGELEAIPGGPKGAQGGRAEQQTQRLVIAGNEVSKALENITDLPVSSSTGLFGGRKQGHGLLSATKEVMANKMTGEEAQEYQVMVSGIQRSLASIEAAGVATGLVGLTHTMDSIIFKEGDTQITKMRKLAETRQITEAGLEPLITDNRIPPEQKKFMSDILVRMKKAIPFSQKDVTRLKREQDKNPDVTFNDLFKSTGLDKSSVKGNHPEDIQSLLDKYGK